MARYIEDALLVGRLDKVGKTTGYEDALILSVCEAVCDAIDSYTQRRFDVATEVSARRFTPTGNVLRVDDISTLTGLVVQTGGPGAYTTTATVDTDFYTQPANAIALGRPITALYGAWPGGQATVQVTALWGWPAVPEGVRQAALIKAHKLFRRKDSPEGIAGLDGYGPVRVSKYEDPDVCMLLDQYIVSRVLVA